LKIACNAKLSVEYYNPKLKSPKATLSAKKESKTMFLVLIIAHKKSEIMLGAR